MTVAGSTGKPARALRTLTVDTDHGVTTVRLSHPPVNAVNRDMKTDLRQAFAAISDDRDVSVAILAAAGDQAFCGGVDLKERPAAESADDGPRAVLDPGWEWRAAQAAIRECAVPVIAAVDGPALGAGFGLVAMCDIIIASDRATFGLPELKVGLLGGASKVMHMLGPYKARQMLFTSEPVTASELHRLGAVAEVVAPGQAEVRAGQLARELAGRSQIALRLAKESLLRVEGDATEQNYRIEQDYTARLAAFEDSREARRAFLERRPARWTWRRRAPEPADPPARSERG
jgi:enoyl-CoA hydratase